MASKVLVYIHQEVTTQYNLFCLLTMTVAIGISVKCY